MREHNYFIRKTFILAKKGEGFTSPNPLVGALVVKNGRVIGQGYHKGPGLPHAEIEAFNNAKGNLEGATLYVNLEPCCHWGRTPPCVDTIIKYKIKKVIISTKDPNPLVNGKSIEILKKNNIEVEVGILEKEARRLNEVFFMNMERRRPFVAIKVGESLDGKIATYKFSSKWITNRYSRLYAHRLREKYDCIAVGINTVIKDNPRLQTKRENIFKLIIDPHLKIRRNLNIFKYTPKERLIIVSDIKNRKKKEKSWLEKKAKIIFVERKGKYLSFLNILKELYQLGIASVLFEGGGFTLGRLFDEGLVDKVYFFIAPKIIGGDRAIPSIGGRGVDKISNCWYLEDVKIKRIKGDFLIVGYPIKKEEEDE